MAKVLVLCVTLCVGFVSCQFGFFPPREDRRFQASGTFNFLPDRITQKLSGIFHLRPENQNSNPAYIYPFNGGPGIINGPDQYQNNPNAYGQNQYHHNHGHNNPQGQYNPNEQNYPYGQNGQQYSDQNGQQYPNQYGQNGQPYSNQNGQQYSHQNGQQYSNQYGQQYTNQNGQNGQQYTNENEQNGQQYPNQYPNGQNNQNNEASQSGQVGFPTSDPTKVNFVNNFNEPDPVPASDDNGPAQGKSTDEGSNVMFVQNGPPNVPPSSQNTPNVSPVNFNNGNQLTSSARPQTGLPALTPVPEFEKRNNFNFGGAGIFQETCQTVDNGIGSCISLLRCPPYLKVLQDSRNNGNAVQLLRRAHCGFEGNDPKVCCPRPGIPAEEETTPTAITTTTTTTTAPPPTGKTVGGNFVDSLPEPPVCGSSNATFSRVVGGIKAKLGDFPWMALLGYKSKRGPGARWLCGGSIVTSKHVLTAAHCIHGHEDDLYLVRLGELDLESESDGATPTDVIIKAMIKHEQYSPTAFTNDIGILVLERDVTFTHLIKPICIPKDSELRGRSFEDYNPIIAGWGDTEFRGPSATHLQALQLPVVSNDFCAQAYTQYKQLHIDERVLCAGYKKGGKDACQGDSGGPLMQPIWNSVEYSTHFYQIGVVSFGRKCAEAGFPGVYTRVTHFVPWLEEQLLGAAAA